MLIKDIASKTGIGRTTVAFYMDKFPKYMSYKMDGRRKSYDPVVADIIKFISDRYAEQWTADQIRAALNDRYNKFVDIDTDADSDTEAESVAITVREGNVEGDPEVESGSRDEPA